MEKRKREKREGPFPCWMPKEALFTEKQRVLTTNQKASRPQAKGDKRKNRRKGNVTCVDLRKKKDPCLHNSAQKEDSMHRVLTFSRKEGENEKDQGGGPPLTSKRPVGGKKREKKSVPTCRF